MSLARSLRFLPALTLLFALSAQAQEAKPAEGAPATPAQIQQKLPDGCQPSMADMEKFLKLEANETPAGDKGTSRIFNLAVFANQGGLGIAKQNTPGSWTLVGEVRRENGFDIPQGHLPKGSVCILQGADNGFPEALRSSRMYQGLHLAPPAPMKQ